MAKVVLGALGLLVAVFMAIGFVLFAMDGEIRVRSIIGVMACIFTFGGFGIRWIVEGWSAMQENSRSTRVKKKRRRPIDEDEEEDRPRKRRVRSMDDDEDERPRKKRRPVEEEEDEPPRRKRRRTSDDEDD